VKALRTEGANNYDIARILYQDYGEPGNFTIFPTLEEIEPGKNPLLADESQRGPELVSLHANEEVARSKFSSPRS
jgi:hypothetical protein